MDVIKEEEEGYLSDYVGEQEDPGVGERDDEGLFFCVCAAGLEETFALWRDPSAAHSFMRNMTTYFIERHACVSRVLALRAPKCSKTLFLANAAAAYLAAHPGFTVAVVAPHRALRQHIASTVRDLMMERYSPGGECSSVHSPREEILELRFRNYALNAESRLCLVDAPSTRPGFDTIDVVFVHHSANAYGDPVAAAAAAQLSSVVVSFHN